ncbi:hypothetical protein Hdeb2414_s0001g00001211 [Helianthus debilis subsp. tardiflorus]
MAKMTTRSSPAKNPEHNSPPKCQGLTKNPSLELCRFTDPEIDQLRHCLPDGTIFRPFDSSMKSDCESESWVTFPTSPFQIGYDNPFPAFTQSFFTLIGLCYIQAMPILEHIIENEGINIGLSELSHMYNLVSQGSHRFLFKHKPQQPHPLMKVTKNDTH